MQIDWFTFLAQIVNFLILIWLLKRFLYGPILKVMDRREEQVTDRLEEARLKLGEAEEKARDYSRKLQNLERDKKEMVQQARKEAEQVKNELLHEAREEIERTRKRWLQSLESEKDRFLGELQVRAADRIIDIAKKIVSDLADQELEGKALNLFLQKLEELDPAEAQQALRASTGQATGEMRVRSTFPLNEKEQKRITHKLEEVLEVPVALNFEISDRLLFGIEIRTPGWKVGWNAESYLDELRESLDRLFRSETDVMIREQPLSEKEGT